MKNWRKISQLFFFTHKGVVFKSVTIGQNCFLVQESRGPSQEVTS